MDKYRIRFWGTVIYSLVSIFCLYASAVETFPSVIVGTVMSAFDLTARGYSFLSATFLYGFILMQIPVGLLIERFSRRIVIFLAVFLIAIGCLIFGFATSPYVLALGRFLMGVGSAFSFVGAYVVIGRWFPPAMFAFLAGLTEFAAAFGSMIGQIPFAVVSRDFGWRFSVQGLGWVGMTLAVLCLIFIHRHPQHSIVPLKKNVPVRPSLSAVLSQTQNWYLSFFAFCVSGPVFIFGALWGVPYLMVRFAIPNTMAAIMTSMVWLGGGILCPIMGGLSHIIKKQRAILWVSALCGITASTLLIYVNVSMTLAYFLLFLIGAASASHILSYSFMQKQNRQENVATSLSFLTVIFLLGGAILQPVTGIILSAIGHDKITSGVRIYSLEAFHNAFLLIPILYFISFCISAFLLKDVRKKA